MEAEEVPGVVLVGDEEVHEAVVPGEDLEADGADLRSVEVLGAVDSAVVVVEEGQEADLEVGGGGAGTRGSL